VKNKLSLKTERLTELTTDDLHRVQGAAAQQTLTLCLHTVHGCTTAVECP
jgi:hypothetical protein